jgi:hypothetical protein
MSTETVFGSGLTAYVDVQVDPVVPVRVRDRSVPESRDDIRNECRLRTMDVRVPGRAVASGRGAVHPVHLDEYVLVAGVGSLPGIVGAVGAVLVDAIRQVPFTGIVEVAIEVGVDAESLPVIVEPVFIRIGPDPEDGDRVVEVSIAQVFVILPFELVDAVVERRVAVE